MIGSWDASLELGPVISLSARDLRRLFDVQCRCAQTLGAHVGVDACGDGGVGVSHAVCENQV